MNHLARKFSRAKWDPKPYLAPNEIRADALTRCLCTSDDTLSFWRCGPTKDDVDEVALALVTGMERVDKIDIVLVEESQLRDAGLKPEPSAGRTPVSDLGSRHVDVAHLDSVRLAAVAKCVADSVRAEGATFRYTKKHLEAVLRRALSKGRFKLKDVHQGLQRALSEPK